MRLTTITTFIAAAMLALSPAIAEDWPTYARDSARSAVTPEKLPAELEQRWVYQSPQPPHQAWPGPAKWDGYNKVYNLADRMVFDKVFQVAVAGDRVFFGSSVDDKIYCKNAKTGETIWQFFTEGPVRLSPTFNDGKLYVGSDDGFVYCLNAQSGELIWKHRIGPRDHRVPGNGRMISLWPIRTAVVVMDGHAYACAGVFPSEIVFLAAMDARTGEEKWKTEMKDLPAQGYMLGSPSRLYVTTGRERPIVFNRADGKRLFQVQGGGGGTYALLVGDSLLYGPGKTGEMALSGDGRADHIASFAGNHMIVNGGISYLHDDDTLRRLDRDRYLALLAERNTANAERGRAAKELEKAAKAQDTDRVTELRKQLTELSDVVDEKSKAMQACYTWAVDCPQRTALILAGETIYAGGDGEVAAYHAETGEKTWQAEVNGRVFGIAAANGKLFVSTDKGAIHCFGANDASASR